MLFGISFHTLAPLYKKLFLATLGPVYTGTDPNGSVPIRVQIGFPFTLELLDLYRCGSAIRISLGSLSKVYPFGSVPVEVQCKRLERRLVQIAHETTNFTFRGKFNMILECSNSAWPFLLDNFVTIQVMDPQSLKRIQISALLMNMTAIFNSWLQCVAFFRVQRRIRQWKLAS